MLNSGVYTYFNKRCITKAQRMGKSNFQNGKLIMWHGSGK